MPFNEVTTNSNIVSASPFHVVTYQEVIIDISPDAKEVYKQGGKYINDVWTDLFALTDLGLSKLANAAGIHGTPERIDDRGVPYVCAYRFNGEWVQPDSTILSFATDYELDLRDYITINGATVKGARFEQAQQAELDLLIEQHFRKNLGGLRGDAKKNKLALLRKDLPSEELKAFEERAEEKALKFIIQMRVHMVSRAQTGAKERFIRKVLGLKNAYSLAELKNPFRIPRSEFRFDKMVEQLGPEMAKPLLELKAASLLGIAPETLTQYKQLASPQSIHLSHPAGVADNIGETESVIVSDSSTATLIAIPSGESEKKESPTTVVEFATVTEMIVVDSRGTEKSRHETIGVKVANSDWFKSHVLNHKYFQDKNKMPNRFHFDGHLEKHFGLKSPVNLTWEMFVALQNHINGKGDDPKYYKPEAKETGPTEPKSIEDRIKDAGLSKLVAEWKASYHILPDSDHAEFIEQVENVLFGISNGFFSTSTPEGLKEIDEQFREAFKKVPF